MTESPLLNSWIQQAVDRSQLEDRRQTLLDCLRVRFPADLTPEVIDTINQQPSASLMRSWITSALGAQSYADFLTVMRQ